MIFLNAPTNSAHRLLHLHMVSYRGRSKWQSGETATRIAYHKRELVQVQTLFYAGRYKQCIALCEQLQSSKVGQTV